MYLQTIANDIRSAVPVDANIPDDIEGLFFLYALVLRMKGEKTSASDVHDAWAVWMLTINPKHPSLIPFSKLDPVKKSQDEPFLAAIRSVAKKMRHDSESTWS